MGVDLTVVIAEGDVKSEDDDRVSHIVGPIYTDEGKISGSARVTQAMIEGTPIEALCGFTWVPSRDPKKYPICPKCKAISEDVANNLTGG